MLLNLPFLLCLVATGPRLARVAWVPPALAQEITLAAAAAATLGGALLCWTAPLHRMVVEEEVKDGRISEAYARRRMRNRACLGPALVGVGLLVGVGVLVL